MKKRWLWLIIVAAIIVVLILIFFRNKNQNSSNQQSTNSLPQFFLEYKVKRSELGDYLEVTGNVEADIISISSKVAGEIVEIFVTEGQQVKKGEPVAKIDDLSYRKSYLEALSNYESSLNSSERLKELRKLELEIAKKNLENATITTPTDGIIDEVNVKIGDIVGQGTVIATLIDENSLCVKAWIDEVDLKKVKENSDVVVEFEQLGINLNGKINRISPSAVSSGGIVSIPIEITLEGNPWEKGVIPNLTCNVKILLMSKKNVIVIPRNGLSNDENGYYVMVKNGNTTEKRYIETGEMTEDVVEVVSGLNEGETILIQPNRERLREFMQEIGGSQQFRTPFGGPPPVGR